MDNPADRFKLIDAEDGVFEYVGKEPFEGEFSVIMGLDTLLIEIPMKAMGTKTYNLRQGDIVYKDDNTFIVIRPTPENPETISESVARAMGVPERLLGKQE